MTRQYKTGQCRQQSMLLPPSVDEYVSEGNPVRAIDAYFKTLDLQAFGFQHAGPYGKGGNRRSRRGRC